MIQPDARARLADLLATPESPYLGPGPRPGVEPLRSLEAKLRAVLGDASHPSARLARALVLLWHDHLDAAHRIAQEVESADGSYVHGVMHRREPDYGNAKYWFRRVGQHPCFDKLAERAVALLRAGPHADLERSLTPRGQWDPFAFIDACEEAAGRSAGAPLVQTLRAIQKAEFELLLERFSEEEVEPW
jgi:hypothetical protein